MADSILTPVSVWNDFKVEGERNIEILEETVKDGIIISRFYMDGKIVGGEPTRVFCTAAKSEKPSLLPCVYVLPDFKKDIDERFLISLAERGYYAFSTDFSGKKDGKEYYTVYPETVNYANYELSKDCLEVISTDVKSTAWYEWGCIGKYAIDYVSSLSFITGVGAVGVKTGASVLWNIAANENRLLCAAFLFDAGWNAYFKKGSFKFDGETPEFNDSDLKFLAGIDAQAYASFVKIPSLIISATNSEEYDFDRASDTISRINKSVYSAIDYSVNASDVLDSDAYTDVTTFLDAILLKGFKPENVFPALPDIEGYVENGKIEIEVDAVMSGLKKVMLYAAEGGVKQSLRAWKAVGEIDADELCNGQFFFNYTPFGGSDSCAFFVRAEYESGFTVSSGVINKKFTEKEIDSSYKSNLIFSGREKLSESVFAPFYEKDYPSFIDEKKEISLKKGPMDIYGLTSEIGLITYKINSEKDKPSPDSFFMLDVFFESDGIVTVSLLSADKEKYSFVAESKASKVWRNYKIALGKFKSAEGLSLKDYSQAVAVLITGEGKFIVNNFLWL